MLNRQADNIRGNNLKRNSGELIYKHALKMKKVHQKMHL